MYNNSGNFKWLGERWIFTRKVYEEICATIGTRTPEWGGILGSDDGKHISHYYFDRHCERSGASYTMDSVTLNKVIREWNNNGIRFIGVIHSHPYNAVKPSREDGVLAESIIESMDVGGELFTPIVQVSPELNGNIRIYPYTFTRSVEMKAEKLVIEKDVSPSAEARRIRELDKKSSHRFSRIRSAFPYEVMCKKAAVIVGCGGSRAFCEELARTGVSTFYLYDKDTVEATNIATQGAYVSEIGRLKVEVIKERILDINPLANVHCFAKFLDDNVSDEEFALETKLSNHSRKDIILCGCTDSVTAQMRCELLSRKYNLPYLAAQIYAGGKGHEIIFTYPGLTKSCPMCMVGSRYSNIFAHGGPTGGSSAGTPILVTDHLNSVKSYLALCMLCYDDDATIYYRTLNKYANSNYFMSKCSEDFVSPVFDRFDKFFATETELTLPFGTVAIKQTPEDDCIVCSSHNVTHINSTIEQLHEIINKLKR